MTTMLLQGTAPAVVMMAITYGKAIALMVCGYKMYDAFSEGQGIADNVKKAAPYAIGLFLIGGGSFLVDLLGIDGDMSDLLTSWRWTP